MNLIKKSIILFLIGILLLPNCSKKKKNNLDDLITLDFLLNGRDRILMEAIKNAGVTPLVPPVQESAAIIALGKNLFYDKILSGNQNISCATCHHPTAALGDGLPLSIGTGGSGTAGARTKGTGVYIARNAPHLFNIGFDSMKAIMFWDGRVAKDPATGILTTPEPGLNGAAPALSAITAQLTSALAAQAIFPLMDSNEMVGTGNTIATAAATSNDLGWKAIMARLVGTAADCSTGGIAGYITLFKAAYGGTNCSNFNIGHVGRAIAAYERSVGVATGSPFDRYIGGNMSALTNEEKDGAMMFFNGGGRCVQCHRGPQLSDEKFHVVANPQLGPGKEASKDDRGQAHITGSTADNYKFKTATLRNVELTGPWTHAGAYASLENVITHYSDPGKALNGFDTGQLRADYIPQVDNDQTRKNARIAALDSILQPPMNLRPNQIANLVTFLKALTDPASRNLNSEIPASVPSGLTVSD